MRACPQCGYETEETAITCARCHQALLPRAPEMSLSLPSTALETASMKVLLELRLACIKLLLFLLGVALGLIPTAIFYVGLASLWWVFGCLLFLVSLPFIFYVIVQCMEEERDRFQPFGYGLFVAVMVTPIVVVGIIITQPILLHFHFVW